MSETFILAVNYILVCDYIIIIISTVTCLDMTSIKKLGSLLYFLSYIGVYIGTLSLSLGANVEQAGPR